MIQNLIEKASERIGELTGEINPCGVALRYWNGHAEIETPQGKVHCYVLTTSRHSFKSTKPHVKATFKLNGKVISRANLEHLLTASNNKPLKRR